MQSVRTVQKKRVDTFLSDQNKFPKIQKQNEKNIFNVFKKHYSAKKNFEKEENIQKYFYYRLTYSLLVASDYHATTEFMQDMKKMIWQMDYQLQNMKNHIRIQIFQRVFATMNIQNI